MSAHKPLLIVLMATFVPAFTTQDAMAADQVPTRQVEDVTHLQLPSRIITLDGKTYQKVILDKIDPDGLLVQFSPAEGGSGTAKLKFRNLPVELQKRYGYDADRSGAYEAAQVRAEAVWRAELAVWMERREAAQAEQAAVEKQMRADAELRRAEAEKAQAEAARYAQAQPVGYYYPWWPSGCYDSGSCNIDRRFNHHVPRLKPVAGIVRSSGPSSPVFAPMRPSGR